MYPESRSAAPQLDLCVETNFIISYTSYTFYCELCQPSYCLLYHHYNIMNHHETFHFLMHIEPNVQHTPFTFQIQQIRRNCTSLGILGTIQVTGRKAVFLYNTSHLYCLLLSSFCPYSA